MTHFHPAVIHMLTLRAQAQNIKLHVNHVRKALAIKTSSRPCAGRVRGPSKLPLHVLADTRVAWTHKKGKVIECIVWECDGCSLGDSILGCQLQIGDAERHSDLGQSFIAVLAPASGVGRMYRMNFVSEAAAACAG